MSLSYFVDIVRRDHPEWPETALYWQARRMQQRDPIIRQAVAAGLTRDNREKMVNGLGVWWNELQDLTPEERGFVMAHVRSEFGLKPGALRDIASVHKAQGEEKYEEEADALAADWREKSDRPDKRVSLIRSLRDLLRPAR